MTEVRLPLKVQNLAGLEDDAVAVLTEDGIYIEGPFTDPVGISWEELLKLVEHPRAQDMLEFARALSS